ncbi:MAG: hypothetical protein JXR48_06220 [Candidatus Delongbacteria bacterium]|nr:hypothetical protein [Candidatus Delongbacteria bacterium]
MRRIIKFLMMAAILSMAMGLYAQNNIIISPEMTEKQIDNEIKSFIDKELESLGIEQGDEEYQHVQQMVEKIEKRLSQINEEQSSFIDSYGNHDKDDLNRAMKLLRNLYYAERTVSSLLLDGYYKNSDEYNSRLVKDMGLIEEEVMNLKAYEDEIQANVRIAYESLNKSYDSMKNLADIIEGYKDIIAEQQKIIRDEITGNGAWDS